MTGSAVIAALLAIAALAILRYSLRTRCPRGCVQCQIAKERP